MPWPAGHAQESKVPVWVSTRSASQAGQVGRLTLMASLIGRHHPAIKGQHVSSCAILSPMAFHHVALATPDIDTTHRFYTEVMGFEMVKVVIGPTPEGGWAKHVFYDTGGNGLIAFWDLHGEKYPEVQGAMSRSVGLPDWVNHLAFHAVDAAHFDAGRKRWLDHGLDVFEVDHGFCRSIYTNDPNQTMVEWCMDTRPLDDQDRANAVAWLADPNPPEGWTDPKPSMEFHKGDRALRPAWMG